MKRSPDLRINAHYYIQRCQNSHRKPSVIFFAQQSQKILRSERKRIAANLADILGYELIPRLKCTQYEYRKNLKIKINGLSYVLKEKNN